MNSSQIMDKQIKELSATGSDDKYTGKDDLFLDLVSTHLPGSRSEPAVAEVANNYGASLTHLADYSHGSSMYGEDEPEEEIVSSYEFHPIRPLETRSSVPRVWASADSKSTQNFVTKYSSLDAIGPMKPDKEKDRGGVNMAELVSEIDRVMKKHVDDLMHNLEGVSARLSQVETRIRSLENSLDDVKVAVGNNNGITDGKMRELDNIVTEVQAVVNLLQEKHDLAKEKLQVEKAQMQAETSASLPPQQLLPSVPHIPSPIPPSIPQHHLPSSIPPSIPQHHLPSSIPPGIPQHHLPSSIPTAIPQHNLPSSIPPAIPQHNLPSSIPPAIPQHNLPSSVPPTLPQHNLPSSIPPPANPQPSLPSPIPPAIPQPPGVLTNQYPQHDMYYPPPGNTQETPSNQFHVPSVPPSHLTQAPPHLPPPQQPYPPQSINHPKYYGTPSVYEPPSASVYSPGHSGAPGPAPVDHYPYDRGVSLYGGSHATKPPQLPTARILPTASSVEGSGQSATAGRFPVDDVVERVTNMGFSRDQVRSTVQKLTENGQSVELNVVLDKLMSDGESMGRRGWYG